MKGVSFKGEEFLKGYKLQIHKYGICSYIYLYRYIFSLKAFTKIWIHKGCLFRGASFLRAIAVRRAVKVNMCA